MCCLGFVKRAFPFFLTLTVGLFIASFFVTVTAPSFQFSKRERRKNHRQYDLQMEAENMRLRQENNRLKGQLLDQLDTPDFSASDLRYAVPPMPPAPPAPNAVPSRNR